MMPVADGPGQILEGPVIFLPAEAPPLVTKPDHTAITIELLVAVVGETQVALEVKTTVIVLPLAKVVVV